MQKTSKLVYLFIFLPFLIVGYLLYSQVSTNHYSRAVPPVNLYLNVGKLDLANKQHPQSSLVHSGIPEMEDYENLKELDLFGGMEDFSKDFAERHKEVLGDMAVSEPLSVGFKSWEYAYTAIRIEEALLRCGEKEVVKVLDLGSGVTFFPFWLLKQHSSEVQIVALDSSSKINSIYQSVLSKEVKDKPSNEGKIVFLQDDLKVTKAHKNTFDIIYCIDVLSFISNYGKVVQHIKELLNPGGTLVLSFRLSLDHRDEVSEEKAHILLSELNRNFCDVDPFPVSLSERIRMGKPFWTNLKQPKALQKETVETDSEISIVTATFRKCK